ncbi:hypothetical protein HAX54_044867 [Datura stramonium]|uniref:Uncharacterized protein n=1 Tax=Datura stramonium TaxID=4076 RepID=A0ABS8RPN1_DATST|nr:hypothetical protein [Datura stramonium]
MAWRQILFSNGRLLSSPSNSVPSGFASFSSKSNPYIVKVGIPEFLNGVGKGVQTHVEKLESRLRFLEASSPYNVDYPHSAFKKASHAAVQIKEETVLSASRIHSEKLDSSCTVVWNESHQVFSAVFLASMSPLDTLLKRLQRKADTEVHPQHRLGLWRPRAEPVKA